MTSPYRATPGEAHGGGRGSGEQRAQLWDDGPATPPALVAEVAGAGLELAELEERARGYEANSKSANTWHGWARRCRPAGSRATP